MTRVLYELHARDDYRFSPFSWRSIMALLHKGLEFERVPMKFTDRTIIAGSGQDRVPTLEDGDRWVSDSWAIACYLEDTYPSEQSLFGGPIGLGTARFVNNWVDHTLHGSLRRVVVPFAYDHAHPDDRDWLRQSREAMFGMTLEELRKTFNDSVAVFKRSLKPFRETLSQQSYLCGDAAAYADYVLFGSFMWARTVCPRPILDVDDPIRAWRDRLLDLYGGYARKAPGYDV